MANPNPPEPGFIVFDYVSPYAPHKMVIPTRSPSYSTIGNIPQYSNWGATTIDGDDMVDGLMTVLEAFVPSSIDFIAATFYDNQPSYDHPKPIAQMPITFTGAGTLTGWAEAVQRTYFLRTEAFGFFKFVLLDVPTDNLFGRYTTLTGAEDAIIGELTSDLWAWQGRDGARPLLFKNLTVTLNEKLRRSYHLT